MVNLLISSSAAGLPGQGGRKALWSRPTICNQSDRPSSMPEPARHSDDQHRDRTWPQFPDHHYTAWPRRDRLPSTLYSQCRYLYRWVPTPFHFLKWHLPGKPFCTVHGRNGGSKQGKNRQIFRWHVPGVDRLLIHVPVCRPLNRHGSPCSFSCKTLKRASTSFSSFGSLGSFSSLGSFFCTFVLRT